MIVGGSHYLLASLQYQIYAPTFELSIYLFGSFGEEVEVVDEAKGNVKQYLWNVVLIGGGGGGRGYKDN